MPNGTHDDRQKALEDQPGERDAGVQAFLQVAEQLDDARLGQLVEYAQQLHGEQAAPHGVRAQTCPSWCQGHHPSDLERARITDHWRDVARVGATRDRPAPPIEGTDSYVFRLGGVSVACTQEDDDSRPAVYLHATQPLSNPDRSERVERDVDAYLSAEDADDLAAALTRAARLIRLPRGATGRRQGSERPVPTPPAEVTP